jgi:CubicO group peptidase (beta-lactamase class C family)
LAASGVTGLVTATAVLRLVADGRVGLDASANDYLCAVRVADDGVTVRELLSHTAGVANPLPTHLFADRVPDLVALTGPVIACTGNRGVLRPSNGGCAVLGQLIADVTGLPYADAAGRLVLAPLGMSHSSFLASPPDLGPDAVTGYALTSEGTLAPVAARMCAIPAAAGLWATPADIVRLGTGWSSLLPASLAREALTPQTPAGPGAGRSGLGWIFTPRGDVVVHAGIGGGVSASLFLHVPDRRN